MATDHFIGRQFGDFVVRERIGQGGMAVVYRAFQPSVNRDVALKIIPLQDADRQNEVFQSRFRQEARLVAALEHIHILPVYDYGLADDAAYLAMRLLRGGTLTDRLREGPLPMEEAARLFRQFASGLAHAHQKSVIHRDLKPTNIMLDDASNAMLTDFGLAKLIGDSLELTQTGSIVGTPAYMSPEQLRAQPLDHRSDIYSAGVVLYQMVTGRAPFGGPTSDLVSTIYKQLEETPLPPRSINPTVPPDAERVILRALRKDPNERFQSVIEMSQALDQALDLRGSSGNLIAVKPSDQHPAAAHSASVWQRLRAHLALIAALGVIVLLAVILAVILSGRGDSGPQTSYQPPTVLAGEQGNASEAVPTADEIARAKARLGQDGFIAYITCTLTTEYHATQARELGDFAAQDGMVLRLYDSNTDDYAQSILIQKALAEGAKGLIICPLKPSLLDRPMKDAQQAGMPLVFMHSDMPSYGGVLLAGDDYQMGLKAGRFAGQIIASELDGQANVIILDYPDQPILVERANGLEDGMKEFAPQAQVIGRYRGGTREFGEASVSKLLDAGTRFDVILSINDAGAFGAIAALEAAGVAPDQVVISSVDAEELAKEYIQKGYFMRGSVTTNREQFSHTAINAMIKLLAGSTLPETFLIPPGGVVTQQVLEAGNP